MPSEDLQKNLPHLIALAVLIFALLIISTKTGLVACSSLGDSYCDLYYSMLGKPTVLIIRGEDGMGSPDVLARMIEDNHQLPVRKMDIGQVSKGNIADYNIIIVERAREIPTEKLKVFYDYLFNDMGRLVWVGDAGTVGSQSDETCRLMEFEVQWASEEGANRNKHEKNICVKESELSGMAEGRAFEMVSVKRDALLERAFGHISELCADAFGGELGVAETKGYPCRGASYGSVFFKWTNEASFRSTINPWSRGEYEKITTEGKHGGIDFAKSVLGVGFVADDYAVAEFDAHKREIETVKGALIMAHIGFVACSRSLEGELCDITSDRATVSNDLRQITRLREDSRATLSGVVTTLRSIAQQKELKNESSYSVSSAAAKIEGSSEAIGSVEVPEFMSYSEVVRIEEIARELKQSRDELVQLKAMESDPAVQSNYNTHIGSIETLISSVESRITTLRESLVSYEDCASRDVQGVSTLVASETGHLEELETLISYSSPLIDENGVVDFIRQARGPRWEALASRLNAISLECGGEEFKTGMQAAGNAITIAQTAETSPGGASEALAIMQVADSRHPLVKGITQTKSLTLEGLPVPFVLVETNAIDSHQVVQLRVTPAYMGINTWPGIIVKDPKFASHAFGKGVVVYYAFPPETDEVFVKNLVEFLLY